LVYSGAGVLNIDHDHEDQPLSEGEKDLEILILRQQLATLQRKQEKPVKTNRAEKMLLAILTAKLKEVTKRSEGELKGCEKSNPPLR
jgi:hypothetical protein